MPLGTTRASSLREQVIIYLTPSELQVLWEGLLGGREQRRVEVFCAVYSLDSWKGFLSNTAQNIAWSWEVFLFCQPLPGFLNATCGSGFWLVCFFFFCFLLRGLQAFSVVAHHSLCSSAFLASTPQGCSRWYKQNKTRHSLCFKFTFMFVCTSCVPMQMENSGRQERNMFCSSAESMKFLSVLCIFYFFLVNLNSKWPFSTCVIKI